MNQKKSSSARQRRKRFGRLRCTIFFLSLTAAIGALAARYWPIDRNILIPVYDLEQRAGYINLDGRIAIEPQWDWVDFFNESGRRSLLWHHSQNQDCATSGQRAAGGDAPRDATAERRAPHCERRLTRVM